MSYLKTGSETQMGLGHSPAACCAECAAGKACVGTSKPVGDVLEFRASSMIPWLLVLGIGYLVFKAPESHGHLAGAARSELGRAHGAARVALAKYRKRQNKKKLGRYGRR